VSVTVNGVAVPVVYASPWGIKFNVPADVQLGMAEVIVTSQDGYACLGTVSVEKNASRIMTTTDDSNDPAVALNGQTMVTDFGQSTPFNFNSDKRTRIDIFATGITGSASNSDTTNDVTVGNVIRPNFAESVSIEARLGDGRVFLLPVEFAGPQGLPGLDQITVRTIPELQHAGIVQLTLIVGGHRSDMATISIP
jgi:uncharacterized protein (TIGR03437 family)